MKCGQQVSTPCFDIRDLAVMGLLEIARAFGRFLNCYRMLVDAARQRKPKAVILIDWPDFNLKLARRLHRSGFEVIYYIGPQVWAWRSYRVSSIKRYVKRMLVILPFEKEFYEREGLEVSFVGHPLAYSVSTSQSRAEFSSRYGLDASRPIIALLPGSRQKEVQHHLPVMLEAAELLSRNEIVVANESQPRGIPQFVVPVANTVPIEEVDQILQTADVKRASPRIIRGDTYNAVGNADLAFVASGTATVEAALLGTPMLIVYRGSELNWRLLRPLIQLDTFGMVNLIAGKRVVPELIQHDFTPEKVAAEAVSLASDPNRIRDMKSELRRVSDLLREGGPGRTQAAAEVARLILNN